MKLLADNYSKHIQLFGKPYEGRTESMVYTYESGKTIYDVCVFNGKNCYQKNMCGYTYDSELIHKAIEQYYGI